MKIAFHSFALNTFQSFIMMINWLAVKLNVIGGRRRYIDSIGKHAGDRGG